MPTVPSVSGEFCPGEMQANTRLGSIKSRNPIYLPGKLGVNPWTVEALLYYDQEKGSFVIPVKVPLNSWNFGVERNRYPSPHCRQRNLPEGAPTRCTACATSSAKSLAYPPISSIAFSPDIK
jgi:hypothetical protein